MSSTDKQEPSAWLPTQPPSQDPKNQTQHLSAFNEVAEPTEGGDESEKPQLKMQNSAGTTQESFKFQQPVGREPVDPKNASRQPAFRYLQRKKEQPNQDLSHLSTPAAPVQVPLKKPERPDNGSYSNPRHQTLATPERKEPLHLEGIRLQHYQELKSKQLLPQLRLQNRLGFGFAHDPNTHGFGVEEDQMKLLHQRSLRIGGHLSPQHKRAHIKILSNAGAAVTNRDARKVNQKRGSAAANMPSSSYIQNTIQFARSINTLQQQHREGLVDGSVSGSSSGLHEPVVGDLVYVNDQLGHGASRNVAINQSFETLERSRQQQGGSPTKTTIAATLIAKRHYLMQQSSNQLSPGHGAPRVSGKLYQPTLSPPAISKEQLRMLEAAQSIGASDGDLRPRGIHHQRQSHSVARENWRSSPPPAGVASATGSPALADRYSPGSSHIKVASPLQLNPIHAGNTGNTRPDPLGSTLRAPALSPIGNSRIPEQLSAQRTSPAKAPGQVQQQVRDLQLSGIQSFLRIEAEVAGILHQDRSRNSIGAPSHTGPETSSNHSRTLGHRTKSPDGQRILHARTISPQVDEIIDENTASYESVADATNVSPERTLEGVAQQESTNELGERGRHRALNIVYQKYQTPEKSAEPSAGKGPSPKNAKHQKRQLLYNEQSWSQSTGAQKSGFSEVKSRFDQKALLKQIDRQVGKQEVKAPSQRFLSPLAGGGSSFDRRKNSRALKPQKSPAENQASSSSKERDQANSSVQQQHLLFSLLNQNLDTIDQTIREQSQRNRKVSQYLQISENENQQNQILWDEQAIKMRNQQMAKDQSLDGISNALTMKKMEIKGPDLFEHKLKMGTSLPPSMNFDVAGLKGSNFQELVDASKVGPSALLGFINLKQHQRNSRRRQYLAVHKKSSKMELNKDIELLQTGKIYNPGGQNIKVQLSVKAKHAQKDEHGSEVTLKGPDPNLFNHAKQDVAATAEDGGLDGSFGLQVSPGSAAYVHLNHAIFKDYAGSPIEAPDLHLSSIPRMVDKVDILKQLNQDKITKINLVNRKSRLRSKEQVQKIIDNFSNAVDGNEQPRNGPTDGSSSARGRRTLNKQVSKILSDKLVIQENLQNYKPFGSQWVNHKDPDIYESELNVSVTDGERPAAPEHNRGNNRSFLVKITKKPAQMDQQNALKQDQDLLQSKIKKVKMLDTGYNIKFGGMGLRGTGSTSNKYDTQYTFQSGQDAEQKFLDDTSLELDWKHMLPSSQHASPLQQRLNDLHAPGDVVIGHHVKLADQENQYVTNNLQYQHQMNLKQKTGAVVVSKSPNLPKTKVTIASKIGPHLAQPVGPAGTLYNHQLGSQHLAAAAQSRAQLRGQNVHARILGAHADDDIYGLKDLMAVGHIMPSKQNRHLGDLSEAHSPLSGAVPGGYDLQHFALQPIGLPSPIAPSSLDPRDAYDASPPPAGKNLRIELIRHASNASPPQRDHNSPDSSQGFPFQNNQLKEHLKEQLRDQRSAEWLVGEGQAMPIHQQQSRPMVGGRVKDQMIFATEFTNQNIAGFLVPRGQGQLSQGRGAEPERPTREQLPLGNIAKFREQHAQHLMSKHAEPINIIAAAQARIMPNDGSLHFPMRQPSRGQQAGKRSMPRNLNQNHNATHAIHHEQSYMTERQLQEHLQKLQKFQQGNLINANHVAGPAVFRRNAPIQQRGRSQNLQDFTRQTKKNLQQSSGKQEMPASGATAAKPNLPKFAQYIHKRDSTISMEQDYRSKDASPGWGNQGRHQQPRLQAHQNGSLISMGISPFNATHRNANTFHDGTADSLYDRDLSMMHNKTHDATEEPTHSRSQTPKKVRNIQLQGPPPVLDGSAAKNSAVPGPTELPTSPSARTLKRGPLASQMGSPAPNLQYAERSSEQRVASLGQLPEAEVDQALGLRGGEPAKAGAGEQLLVDESVNGSVASGERGAKSR